ncbi:hypothetical protein [Methylobacterium fujisawaense]|uniref:hypothetical protein n=1 Tax=Methylobacterium fujisawaense TaxID=107400 RepID=UPI00313D6637
MLEIEEDDLSTEQTRALRALHRAGPHAWSPPGHVFALDLSGLQSPGVTRLTSQKARAGPATGPLPHA